MLRLRQQIIHRDRSWTRPKNPFDLAKCPTCRALVPGEKHDVRAHKRDHETFQGWLDELGEFMEGISARMAEVEKRTGIAEESIEIPARYSAEVTAFYPDSDESEDEE